MTSARKIFKSLPDSDCFCVVDGKPTNAEIMAKMLDVDLPDDFEADTVAYVMKEYGVSEELARAMYLPPKNKA